MHALLLVILMQAADPAADVRAAVGRFAEAFRDGDVKTLESLLADDYRHTNGGTGSVLDREGWLNYVRTRGPVSFTRYENEDLKIDLRGDVAIVTGVNRSAGTRGGGDFDMALRFTQTWVRTGEGWKRASFHDSPIEPSPREVVERYHAALGKGDAAGVASTIGQSIFMTGGARSTDPAKWQAHMYLSGTRLGSWIPWFVAEAGPHLNEVRFVQSSVRGDSALVVTRETGRNKFRQWKDETVVWMVAREAGAWKIIGYFLQDATNP
jgi:ketosteroid isomerase-like protein